MSRTNLVSRGGLTQNQLDLVKEMARSFILTGGEWFRARSSGERVTLASLYRRGLLERRPRRGVEGAADSAYEYQLVQRLTDKLPRFPKTWCSQCGCECGPGDSGFSSCRDHRLVFAVQRELG